MTKLSTIMLLEVPTYSGIRCPNKFLFFPGRFIKQPHARMYEVKIMIILKVYDGPFKIKSLWVLSYDFFI